MEIQLLLLIDTNKLLKNKTRNALVYGGKVLSVALAALTYAAVLEEDRPHKQEEEAEEGI